MRHIEMNENQSIFGRIIQFSENNIMYMYKRSFSQMLWQNFRGFSSKSREHFSWGLIYFDKFIYFISLFFFL